MSLIAGLGPVVENYCVMASLRHVRSLADLFAICPSAIDEIVEFRAVLERRLGPILMTEHGRVPICRDDQDGHENHCYHAHTLLFPSVPSIEAEAATYYRRFSAFDSLHKALEYALTADDYMLVSPNSRHAVFSESLSAPRQLARTLVARALGRIDRADWRSKPLADEAVRNADQLRAILRTTSWTT